MNKVGEMKEAKSAQKSHKHVYIKEIKLKHNEIFKLLTNQAILLPVFFLPESKLISSVDDITKVINKSILKYISKVSNFVNMTFEDKEETIPKEMIKKQERIMNKYFKQIINQFKNSEEIIDEFKNKFNLDVNSVEPSKEDEKESEEDSTYKFFFKIEKVDRQSNRSLVNYELWYSEIGQRDLNDKNKSSFSKSNNDDDQDDFISSDDDASVDLFEDDEDSRGVASDNVSEVKDEEMNNNDKKETKTKLCDIKIQINKISSNRCVVIIDLESQPKINDFRQIFEDNEIFFNIDNNNDNNECNNSKEFKYENFSPNFAYIDKVFNIYNNLPISKNSESIIISSYKQKIFEFISNFNNVKKINPELTKMEVINKNSKTLKIKINDQKEYEINIKSISKPTDKQDQIFSHDWTLKYHSFHQENSIENHEVTYTIKTVNKKCCYLQLDFKFDNNLSQQEIKFIANQQKHNLILIKQNLEEGLCYN
jgi:hypothetical protein